MKSAAKILFTAIIVLCALRFGTSADFYNIAIISAYFAITLIGATIIHLRVSSNLRDVALVVAGTLALAFIDFRVQHFEHTFFGWISFAGISSLAIMGIESVWTEGEQRKTHLLAFVPSLLFVTSEYFADNMLRWAATVHDKVYDLYLYAFDGSLRVQIPFAVGRYFAQHSVIRQTALLAYIGLSVPIAVVYAGQLRRTGAKSLQCFFTFVITGPMGILFYNAVPALGPAHLFQNNFPWQPLAVDQVRHLFLEPVALAGPRNAIPSLHMAWVLLAWWYSRGLSGIERAIALFYLAFVALATLGTGEHYFIDLVVAVPFALFMESLFAYDLPLFDANRTRGVSFGLLSTCAWLAALRFTPHFFWSTPILSWTLCAATVAIALYFEMRLRDLGKSAPRVVLPSQGEKFERPKTASSGTETHAEAASAPILAEIPKL
jgi:PAP2 superfamily protein